MAVEAIVLHFDQTVRGPRIRDGRDDSFKIGFTFANNVNYAEIHFLSGC